MTEYERAVEAVEAIRRVLPSELQTPRVAVICGTGLGGLSASVKNAVVVNYASIPHFKQSTVVGHAGKLVIGNLGTNNVPVVVMAGRLHSYEGHDITDTVFPVRVFKLLGAQVVIATNAAGGLNQRYRVGDIMLLDDHINFPGLAGLHPLKGPNDERFGPRFPPLSDAYDLELRREFIRVAEEELGLTRPIHEGVYAFVSGPTYETRAECRLLIGMGADAVGMSTVSEVCTARHCGLKVLALSLITNEANIEKTPSARDKVDTGAMDDKKANHEEVIAAGAEAAADIQKVVEGLINRL